VTQHNPFLDQEMTLFLTQDKIHFFKSFRTVNQLATNTSKKELKIEKLTKVPSKSA